YLGPLLVISRNQRGAYILAKLDGSVFDWPVAAFCIIPYFARRSLELVNLKALLNIFDDNAKDDSANEDTNTSSVQLVEDDNAALATSD
ncbi:hypothetical protein HETIRDRAFT_329024, partial [Heterobasidion irregulare TC 32-1]